MAVLIYDSIGQPYAKDYYEIFKSEPYAPGASLIVTKIVPVENWHLPGLLNAIVTHGPDSKDLLIVGHGVSQGLNIPLAAGKNRNKAQYIQLSVLMSKKEVNDKATKCKITKEEAKQILHLRAKVLKLKLGRIEFRACLMGAFIPGLAALKDFLGAEIVGAPDKLDYYGRLCFGQPTKDGKSWADWLKRYPKPQIYNVPGGKVAIHRLLEFHCMAETAQAVTDWVKAYLPASKGKIDTMKVPVHSLLGGGFIFPNESGYVDHIKHYVKGNPLLQGEIFDSSEAIRIPDSDREARAMLRVARRNTGLLDGKAKSRRGPVGMS